MVRRRQKTSPADIVLAGGSPPAQNEFASDGQAWTLPKACLMAKSLKIYGFARTIE
jgi:hypothetical protein